MSSSDCVYIHGFGIGEYRSFGPGLQRIGPCKKVNLLIGQNNSGKSNIIRFISDRYKKCSSIIEDKDWKLTDLEIHKGQRTQLAKFSIAIVPSESWINSTKAPLVHRKLDEAVDWLVKGLRRSACGEACWMDVEFPENGGKPKLSEALVNLWKSKGSFNNAVDILVKESMGKMSWDKSDGIYTVISSLLQSCVLDIPIVTIPAIRNIGSTDSSKIDYSGADIIFRLARLERPEYGDADEHSRAYENILGFVREVTGDAYASLEVPHSRKTINVRMDGRLLPLHALGTGIQEVIILAANATTLQGHVVCIEEPEIHLHPLLQKKLLRYLAEKTSNQYFITTHSAHLLDYPDAAIFHVQLTGSGSVVRPAIESAEKFAVCKDLGYHASDLLQTNCIIWVEGPSDRVYLREWIKLYDPRLTEGIEYSIMFYGGRLLSHLSPEDEEVTEFINLRRMNRNMVVVMDSDRKSAKSRINDTKKRVIASWKEGEPGFAWLTKGREIENYVSSAAMKEALAVKAPGKKHPVLQDAFSQCIGHDTKGPFADKVKVSHWLAEHGKLTLSELDLGTQIRRLCEFIRVSNQLEVVLPQSKKQPKRKAQPSR